MEFRKMVTITLYTRQQNSHWCVEQFFGLCGRGRGWDDLGEWHWNMYNIIYETSHQSRFDIRYWMLGAGAVGRPRGMVWGGRREEGSGWGTRVYLWQIHFDIWQNQYNIVKLNKIKFLKKGKKKKKFCKGYESLEDEECSGWPSEVNNYQLKGSLKLNLLQLYKKLLKNSVSTILRSFSIWSKLEKWKTLISGYLMSWLKI